MSLKSKLTEKDLRAAMLAVNTKKSGFYFPIYYPIHDILHNFVIKKTIEIIVNKLSAVSTKKCESCLF